MPPSSRSSRSQRAEEDKVNTLAQAIGSSSSPSSSSNKRRRTLPVEEVVIGDSDDESSSDDGESLAFSQLDPDEREATQELNKPSTADLKVR